MEIAEPLVVELSLGSSNRRRGSDGCAAVARSPKGHGVANSVCQFRLIDEAELTHGFRNCSWLPGRS
jgi:hypothetical protein